MEYDRSYRYSSGWHLCNRYLHSGVGQVSLAHQQVLQQQHVDHKIANALLKKGTLEAYKLGPSRTALGSICACMNRTTRDPF
jgi:hypothetical protein